MLKSKADVDDLIQLRDVKTNKQDTEHCMRSIETVHKMLKSITVVLIEQMREEKSLKYMLTQANHVEQWIRGFNPMEKNEFENYSKSPETIDIGQQAQLQNKLPDAFYQTL